mmetsp:Transcript_39002/g.103334  ORF Transcript_39002/g.103334 Transcript_39002/m.103334 type:complete len:212 (-) Transcript_39002:15-650(-)
MHKLVRPDHIECGHATNFLWIVTPPLIKRRHRRHDRAHRIYDQTHDGGRAELRASLDYGLCYVCVGLQQLAPGPPLAGHADRNQHQSAALEAIRQVIYGFLVCVQAIRRHFALPFDVPQICADALRRRHGYGQVVHGQLPHAGVEGHQQAERLAARPRGAAHAHLEALLRGPRHGPHQAVGAVAHPRRAASARWRGLGAWRRKGRAGRAAA